MRQRALHFPLCFVIQTLCHCKTSYPAGHIWHDQPQPRKASNNLRGANAQEKSTSARPTIISIDQMLEPHDIHTMYSHDPRDACTLEKDKHQVGREDCIWTRCTHKNPKMHILPAAAHTPFPDSMRLGVRGEGLGSDEAGLNRWIELQYTTGLSPCTMHTHA